MQTPQHSVAGEGEEGCRSQPAETTTITFLKAKGKTWQPGLPAHASSVPAPNTTTDNGTGKASEAASSRAGWHPSSLAGDQVCCLAAQAVPSTWVPPCHPLSRQGAPSCVPGDVLACISAQSGAGAGQAELQLEPGTICI